LIIFRRTFRIFSGSALKLYRVLFCIDNNCLTCPNVVKWNSWPINFVHFCLCHKWKKNLVGSKQVLKEDFQVVEKSTCLEIRSRDKRAVGGGAKRPFRDDSKWDRVSGPFRGLHRLYNRVNRIFELAQCSMQRSFPKARFPFVKSTEVFGNVRGSVPITRALFMERNIL